MLEGYIYIYIYHPYFYSNQIIVQTGHMLEGYIYIYIYINQRLKLPPQFRSAWKTSALVITSQ